MARYILLTSAVSAMRCSPNRSSISIKDEWTVGPTSSVSFREILDADFAEASNTAQILVVVLDSFLTVCIGR